MLISPTRRKQIIDKALSYVGLPWMNNGTTFDGEFKSLDALGLIRSILFDIYNIKTNPSIWNPNWSDTKDNSLFSLTKDFCQPINSKPIPPGSLILFNHTPNHIAKTSGIKISDQKMLISYWPRAVQIATIAPYWTNNIHSVWNFPA